LEGAVCIVLASPLIAVFALVGGELGRWLARAVRRPIGPTVSAVALLPLALALEGQLQNTASFTLTDSVSVAAPPVVVWRAVTHMGAIKAQPSAIFRLGVAYPTAGLIHGEGVGATREGHFSTGVAY